MSRDFDGQNVIVTGAARGIGLAISERLHSLGALVSGWDRDCAPVADSEVFAHRADIDVTDPEQVDDAFDASQRALGHVDVVVANAGVNGPTKPAWEYTLDEWNHVINVDLTGVFLTTRVAIEHMQSRDYGRIVVVASVAGKEGNPGACAYGAAKAGVIGYIKGLARELQPSNITANCIAPAITETELFQEMDDEYIASKRRLIPMNRFCTPAEIADLTAWVASRRCSFTTGQVFDITGGRATY